MLLTVILRGKLIFREKDFLEVYLEVQMKRSDLLLVKLVPITETVKLVFKRSKWYQDL